MYFPMHLHTTLLPLQMGRKIILLSLTVTSRGGGAKRKVKRKKQNKKQTKGPLQNLEIGTFTEHSSLAAMKRTKTSFHLVF